MSAESIDDKATAEHTDTARATHGRDIAVGVASLLVGSWIVVYSQGLPPAPNGGAGSGLFPTLIGAILAGVGVLLGGGAVVSALWRRSRASSSASSAKAEERADAEIAEDAGPKPKGRWSDVIAVLVAIAFYVLVVEPLGFLITMSLVLFGLLLKFGNRLLPSALISVATTGLMYYVFGQLLFVPLHVGLIG